MSVSYVTFGVHGSFLSARGIGPADVKVKAVVDAREPKMLRKYEASLVWSISRHDLFQTQQQYLHPSASLQKMENNLCGGRSNSNHLMS